jgi:hypothetical protein
VYGSPDHLTAEHMAAKMRSGLHIAGRDEVGGDDSCLGENRSATRVDQPMRSVKRFFRTRKSAANPNEPAIVQLSYLIVYAEIVADGLTACLSHSSNDGRSDDRPGR